MSGVTRFPRCRIAPPAYRRGMADHHPAVEEYLETILELEESGIPPLRARIVERLKVSAPAVSETVKRLEREGYLHLDGDRVMQLTDSGRTYATSVMRRHRLAERLLVDVLKVPWHQVHEEAGRLEHAISENLEKHLVALLGDPATCPHGNPIPGSRTPIEHRSLVPLGTLAAGDSAVVRRIDEEIERQRDCMLELETAGVLPGTRVTVSAVPGTSVTIEAPTGPLTLDRAVARRIYVSLDS